MKVKLSRKPMLELSFWRTCRALKNPHRLDLLRDVFAFEGEFVMWPLGKGKATFCHDPANPVPTCGGRMTPGGGIREQSAVEAREDVLKFTGEVLKEDLEVTIDAAASNLGLPPVPGKH